MAVNRESPMSVKKGRLSLTVLPQDWEHAPKTRGDCADGPRPCPWNSCRHSLEEWNGGESGKPSCALDVVDEHGGLSGRAIGAMLGVSDVAIWKIEQKGLTGLRAMGVEWESPPQRKAPTPGEGLSDEFEALSELADILAARRRAVSGKRGRK